MADMLVGGLAVDQWLKVKEFGLLIGADNQLIPELLVDIDMSAVQPNYCVKFRRPCAVRQNLRQGDLVERPAVGRGGRCREAASIRRCANIDRRISP
jgi:hypothetical protein